VSDNLEWRNRHAVLLREPQWAGIAARENYKIRADLRPLFEAHPVSEDLLVALSETGQYREGCEFIARMTHRRAAVWWGYCCLLSLFEERKAVASGARTLPEDPLAVQARAMALKAGIELPKPGSLDAAGIDDFCKAPKVDCRAMLQDYVPPPQDRSAIDAASRAVGDKIAKIDALIPAEAKATYAAQRARIDADMVRTAGATSAALFEQALERAEKAPLVYTVRRADSPELQPVLQLQDALEAMRKDTIGQIKAAFPEKYPKTPEAAMLLKAEADRISDDAVQAVWRWIVAPDERNTALALAAGNAAAQKPEGMLAYTAAWSFGDLTPEGKQVIPVPPELPGTGLNSTLLMLALAEGGYRKMPERYELYFELGLEVVYGKNLWPDAVMEELAPHRRVALGAAESVGRPAARPVAAPGPSPYQKWTPGKS